MLKSDPWCIVYIFIWVIMRETEHPSIICDLYPLILIRAMGGWSLWLWVRGGVTFSGDLWTVGGSQRQPCPGCILDRLFPVHQSEL